MLTIRLARVGKKNRAQFQIVLQEHSIAPGGRHVEILGSYDPHSKAITLKEEKIKQWLSKGAKASPTVHNLLVSKNIISGKKIAVKIPKKKVEENKEETAPTKTATGEEVKKEEKTEEIKEAKTEVKAEVKEEAPKEEKKEEVKKETPKEESEKTEEKKAE